MSEQQEATDVTETVTEETEQTKPTETVEFWKQKAREQEKRAKDNAAAAKRLAEIEQAQKSDAEKSADAIAAAKADAETARAELLRFKIAAEYGLPAEDVEALEEVSSEEGMRRIAERLRAREDEAAKPRSPKPDPNQGRPSTSGGASTADQFAAAIGSHL